MSGSSEEWLDTRGSLCPQPIIDLGQRMRRLPVNGVLVVLSDDAAFPWDLRAWCAGTGHELLELRQEGRVHTARLRKTRDSD